MHTGKLDRLQLLDRARQILLERALETLLFLQRRGAETRRALAFLLRVGVGARQAARREAVARDVQLRGRHFDAAVGSGEAVGNVELFERGDDFAAGAVGQLGVEHPVVGRVEPPVGGTERCQRQHEQKDQHEAAQRARLDEKIAQTAQPARHGTHLIGWWGDARIVPLGKADLVTHRL